MKKDNITAINRQKRDKKIINYWEAQKDNLTDVEIRLNLFKMGLGANMTTWRVLVRYKAEKYQGNLPKYKESDWAKYFFTKMVKESEITKMYKAEFEAIENNYSAKKFWKICFNDHTGYYLKVRIAIGKSENACMIDLMQRNVQLMVEAQAMIRKLIDDAL